jgi:hypothetical protein
LPEKLAAAFRVRNCVPRLHIGYDWQRGRSPNDSFRDPVEHRPLATRFGQDVGAAIDLSLAPPFLGCFHRRHRFANTAPSVSGRQREVMELAVGSWT